jgi:hypothetical protein
VHCVVYADLTRREPLVLSAVAQLEHRSLAQPAQLEFEVVFCLVVQAGVYQVCVYGQQQSWAGLMMMTAVLPQNQKIDRGP